jgi:hypothetical protein
MERAFEIEAAQSGKTGQKPDTGEGELGLMGNPSIACQSALTATLQNPQNLRYARRVRP